MIPPLLTENLLPSHVIGILSLVLLAIACTSRFYGYEPFGERGAGFLTWWTAMGLALPQRIRG